jgi:hypothetical protein
VQLNPPSHHALTDEIASSKACRELNHQTQQNHTKHPNAGFGLSEAILSPPDFVLAVKGAVLRLSGAVLGVAARVSRREGAALGPSALIGSRRGACCGMEDAVAPRVRRAEDTDVPDNRCRGRTEIRCLRASRLSMLSKL